ncbi:hypothetical protein BKA62DRAFT_488562 [Auriculariales sp. MPI-PUGE-AT-0066]|nr:hypothetical protein BKA62DRAFT_488562 [Auriculariales sp. MPI-PUGE-AT-0066]
MMHSTNYYYTQDSQYDMREHQHQQPHQQQVQSWSAPATGYSSPPSFNDTPQIQLLVCSCRSALLPSAIRNRDVFGTPTHAQLRICSCTTRDISTAVSPSSTTSTTGTGLRRHVIRAVAAALASRVLYIIANPQRALEPEQWSVQQPAALAARHYSCLARISAPPGQHASPHLLTNVRTTAAPSASPPRAHLSSADATARP